ncbi:hypothetical protein OC834_000232 [Tilletia horrida]|nr:hypothetical protein OC834_000232 [Tilletia horrida]
MKLSLALGLVGLTSATAAAAEAQASPAERYLADLAATLGLRSDLTPAAPLLADRSQLEALEAHNPLDKRIVGSITCTPYKTGVLKAKSRDGTLANAHFTHRNHGVPNYDGGSSSSSSSSKPSQIGVLATSVGDLHPTLPEASFTFSTCNGTFMGTAPSKGAFNGSPATTFTYGHLSPAGAVGERCVRAYALGVLDKPQHIVQGPCSRSDDSSQLFQWWELVEVPSKTTGKTTLYLQFVGVSTNPSISEGDFPGTYALVKRSSTVGKGHDAVDATWVGVNYLSPGHAVTNPYQLVLA